ncbi:fumarylacetoacetate hydrolase family protein [Alloalcanivorax sp. C16-2]|uniref:fumarylacetoacetate hydrolase family protein n=1 Tax=Alloalcanivorax sp. C16-2 TaxID=3390052 RepID=UPI003970CC84
MRHALVEINGDPVAVTVDDDGLRRANGDLVGTDRLRWLPPVSGTVFGIALNDRALLESHLDSFNHPPYEKPPTRPVLFIKTPNTRNGHQRAVSRPAGERLQPGPSLGVVIGKSASRVREADALDYVAGYTVVNEFSLPEDSYYRPAVKAKCRDGFCPLGPWVTSADEVGDPAGLAVRLSVNGELKQEGNTANFVRPVARLIAELSEFMTLHEGDVLIAGVPAGRVDVQPGDEVAVEIDRVGTLVSFVTEEGAPREGDRS